MAALSYGKFRKGPRILGFVAVASVFLSAVASLSAATKVIILVGLAGEQAVWEDFDAERSGWEEALAANNLGEGSVKTIISPQSSDDSAASREVFRNQALEAFAAWKKELTPQDDALLVLIGHGSTQGKRYIFQNRGERLMLKDFQVLTELPARSLTAVITGPGGLGLTQLLRGPHCTVLSATMVETEINHTKFGTFLATQLAAKPERPLLDSFRSAAEHTEAYYTAQYRAQTEHAILYLGADEGIEPPFDLPAADPRLAALPRWTLSHPGLDTPPDAPQVTSADATPPGARAEDMPAAKPPEPAATPEEPSELGSAQQDLTDLNKLPQEWRLLKESAVLDQVPYLSFRDATLEEMALFKNLPAATDFPEAGGVMLLNTMRVDVKDKYAYTRTRHNRLYVRDIRIRDLVDNLYTPPMNGLGTIKYLKTISPSGKVVEVEPDALANFARTASGGVLLFAPGVEPGVIVESEISEAAPAPAFGAFYDETAIVQDMVPTLSQEFSVVTSLPDTLRWKVYGKESGQRTEEKLPYSYRQTWKWENLPARPPREMGTPSDFETDPRLVLTSYKDWSEFLDWYQSLMRSVHESSDLIKAKAAELAAGRADETAKVKAVYDYVNNLRYIAIEGGANGWRPRNPTTTLARQFGDCKDKANLTISLLDEMGIKAYFVLVSRGRNVDPEVPTYAFNHAIAVLPGKTPEAPWTWLDTTDTSTPFGMVPPGDADRWGFVITGPNPKDFELRKITVYQNQFSAESRLDITLNSYDPATGLAEGVVEYRPAGVEQYEWAQMMRAAEPAQVRQQLAAKFLDVWPEVEPKEIELAAGPGTKFPNDDPRFHLKLVFDLGAPSQIKLPRPFWKLDRELASALWGRQTDFEINNGYPQKFTQTLTVPKSLNLPFGPGHQEGKPLSYMSSSVGWTDKGENRALECQLDIKESKIAAADLPNAKDLLNDWVKDSTNLKQALSPATP